MFSAMRIRAITDRNIMLFSLVFVLLCVPVGTNLVNAIHFSTRRTSIDGSRLRTQYLFAISVPDTVGDPVGCIAIAAVPDELYTAYVKSYLLCTLADQTLCIAFYRRE